MSGLGVLAARSLRALRGSAISQRANLHSKPAKANIGLSDVAIGMTVFSVTILFPSGWILSNLESYKKRD